VPRPRHAGPLDVDAVGVSVYDRLEGLQLTGSAPPLRRRDLLGVDRAFELILGDPAIHRASIDPQRTSNGGLRKALIQILLSITRISRSITGLPFEVEVPG
jgi:hypothetical protein